MNEPAPPRDERGVDWRLTTWEGARREQMRRWAALPLERAIMALEEMESLSQNLQDAPSGVSEARESVTAYGRDTTHNDLEMTGCTPEPLMAYLKALGVLRLVSEQHDSKARGWWKNDVFWLRTSLDRDALVRFFLEEYRPTPIVVPWSGGDFFGVNWNPKLTKQGETPTSSKAIEAILCTTTARFEQYRVALKACKATLDKCGIDTKEKMGKEKWAFIKILRSFCEESRVLEWVDAAANAGPEKFACLLGSGGGSDGNTHFSDNFMQNLWDVLSDFDDQRQAEKGQSATSVVEASRRQLNESLFSVASSDHILKRTSSLYDSGAVGGQNATQGMERDSLSNPWDIILALEGVVSFAGSTAKRLACNNSAEAAFPFQVSASVTMRDRLVGKEQAGKEVWLPIWSRQARSGEVLLFLREGRAQCGPRSARSGVDMARAIASLSVDRGIKSFHRYAIVKGRVGGDNYNTAASLGRFEVTERSGADLLREIDLWLEGYNGFRGAAGDKQAPPRIVSALRRIDSAVFEFCKYGGSMLFQEIVVALGAAERVLATSERFRQKKRIRPLADLSEDWIAAADDGSMEFAVALALASIHDTEGRIGPFRANLEPVDWGKHCRAWAEKDRAVVWNATDLTTNMLGVLQRRMMDSAREGCANLPLSSRTSVPLEAVSAFLGGELDDERIENLVWGLMLIKGGRVRLKSRSEMNGGSVPRPYALLKLLFLPRPLVVVRGADGEPSVRFQRNFEQGGVSIRPESSILQLLRGGRLGEACAIAMRRLRASGLPPMPGPIRGRRVRDDDWRELDGMTAASIDPKRLAATLLIPISDVAVSKLARLIIRGDEVEQDRVVSVIRAKP